MKQVHFRVEDELYQELNAYSLQNEQSLQDCVREAVAYYVTDIKRRQKRNLKKQFSFIDLFAGIGGMRIAFDRVGGHCVYSNEWNKYSQQTYFANFGEQPDGDITQVNEKDIPNHDILVAGFPCQPFSIASLGIHWKYFIVIGICIILITLITQYIVLATMTTVISYPIFLFIKTGNWIVVTMVTILSCIIIMKHLNNLIRIVKGEEFKFKIK